MKRETCKNRHLSDESLQTEESDCLQRLFCFRRCQDNLWDFTLHSIFVLRMFCQNICTVSEIHVPYWKYMCPNGNIYTLALPCPWFNPTKYLDWGKMSNLWFSVQLWVLFIICPFLLIAYGTPDTFPLLRGSTTTQKEKPKHPNFITTLASQIPYPAILPTTQSTTMDLVSVAMMVVALRKVVDGDCRLSEASSLWKLAARRPCWAPPAHRPPLHHPSSPSCNTTPTLTFFRIVVYCFPDFVILGQQ